MERRTMPGDYTVLHDVATGAVVVDVTAYRVAFDPGLLRRLGAPALVCFGTHPGEPCSLGRGADDHSAAIELVDGRPDQAAFARRLSEALDASRLPVSVIVRPSDDQAMLIPDNHVGAHP